MSLVSLIISDNFSAEYVDILRKYTGDVDYKLFTVENMDAFKSAALSCDSKYAVYLEDGAIVTAKWLSNLIACAEAMPDAGLVASVSNKGKPFQIKRLDAVNYQELQHAAAINAVSGQNNWMEVLTTLSPAVMVRTDCLKPEPSGFLGEYFWYDLCFGIRRAGYKAIVTFDSYVYWHNQRLEKDETELFCQKYGVDPVLDADNFELEMFEMLNDYSSAAAKPNILGIEVKCGAPLLIFKNAYHERGLDTVLNAVTRDERFLPNLRGFCENSICGDVLDTGILEQDKFDYIILGECLNHRADAEKLITALAASIKQDGHFYFKYDNSGSFNRMEEAFSLYSGKLLSRERKLPEYGIDLKHLIRALGAAGLCILNMRCGAEHEADVMSGLERQIRKYVTDEDFILAALAKVKYREFIFDICRY